VYSFLHCILVFSLSVLLNCHGIANCHGRMATLLPNSVAVTVQIDRSDNL
jgi:hypothetical protein